MYYSQYISPLFLTLYNSFYKDHWFYFGLYHDDIRGRFVAEFAKDFNVKIFSYLPAHSTHFFGLLPIQS